MAREWKQRADELAAESIGGGEPIGWFERLYAEAVAGTVTMPWDRTAPHPLLQEWADARSLDGAGQRAVVVGCGLGADAEFLASRDFATTGFDVSPTAIESARARHPASTVDYRVADLLALPRELTVGFDLVVEIFTLQAMPDPPRRSAAKAVTSLVGRGGTLLAVAFRHTGNGPGNQGPPFPLTRETMIELATGGLELRSLEELDGPSWRAEYHRR